MIHPGALVLSSLLWWRPLGYAIIFLGMMIEGDGLLFTAAFLTHQGVFDPGDMAVVVLSGVLIGDVLWCWLGAWLAGSPSFASVSRWLERVTARFDTHLRGRMLRTIFVSKFAYGLHHPLLMRAGAIGIPTRRFLKNDVLATVAWVAVVGGLGYGVSASFVALQRSLRFAERALVLGLFIFFFFEYLVRRRSRRQL